MKKTLKRILIIILVISTSYIGLSGYLIYNSPLKYAEMDLDGDGAVSFSEIEYSANYGVREVESHEGKCLEYYALKDGLTLKTVCKFQDHKKK